MLALHCPVSLHSRKCRKQRTYCKHILNLNLSAEHKRLVLLLSARPRVAWEPAFGPPPTAPESGGVPVGAGSGLVSLRPRSSPPPPGSLSGWEWSFLEGEQGHCPGVTIRLLWRHGVGGPKVDPDARQGWKPVGARCPQTAERAGSARRPLLSFPPRGPRKQPVEPRSPLGLVSFTHVGQL